MTAATSVAASDQDTLSATISNIEYRNTLTHQTLLRVMSDANEQVFAMGKTNMPVRGESLILYGHFSRHHPYARVFKFNHYVARPPNGAGNLIQYLIDICDLPSLFASKIVDRFGDQSLDVLENDPARFLEIESFTEAILDRALSAWRQNKRGDEVTALLKEFGIIGSSLNVLKARLGEDDNLISRLRENPYLLYLHLEHINFSAIETLIMRLGVKPDPLQRMTAVIIWALRCAHIQGHTYIPLDRLYHRVGLKIGMHLSKNDDSMRHCLDSLIDLSLIINKSDNIAIINYAMDETKLAADFKRMTDAERQYECYIDNDRLLKQLENDHPSNIASVLKEAVVFTLTHKIALIDAPCYRDRLLCLRTLFNVYQRLGVNVQLIATDLKSCSVISQACETDCFTPEGIIGAQRVGPPTFTHNNPLTLELLLVFEADRLNVKQAQRLLDATPASTGIVFIGDQKALPPLGAGQPYRDAINSDIFSTHLLGSLYPPYDNDLGSVHQHAHQQTAMDINRFEVIAGQTASVVPLNTRDSEDTQAITIQLYRDYLFGNEQIEPQQCLIAGVGHARDISDLNLQLQKILNPDNDNVMPGHPLRKGDPVYFRAGHCTPYIPAGTRGMFDAQLTGDKISIKLDDNSFVIIEGINRKFVVPAYVQPASRTLSGQYQNVILIHCGKTPIDADTFYHITRMATEHLFLVGDPVYFNQAPITPVSARHTQLIEALKQIYLR